jgi:hypothetical protein
MLGRFLKSNLAPGRNWGLWLGRFVEKQTYTREPMAWVACVHAFWQR